MRDPIKDKGRIEHMLGRLVESRSDCTAGAEAQSASAGRG